MNLIFANVFLRRVVPLTALSNLLWTCETVFFAANEGNQYDCRRPQVPNTTHLTLADARRNDAWMDAPGWMAATNGRPTPRTWAEKEQRNALWMKAVWRSFAGCSEAGLLRALAANRIEAATPFHARRSVGRIANRKSLALIGSASAQSARRWPVVEAEALSITRLEGSRWRGGRLWSWNRDHGAWNIVD